MSGVSEQLRVDLRHVHNVSTRATMATTTITTTYSPNLSEVRRPADGIAEIPILCGTCGRAVPVRVYSVRRTVVAKRRWLWLSATGLVLLIAGVVLWFRVKPEEFALLPFCFLIAASGCAALAGAWEWLFERGLRLPDTRTGHELG